MADIGGDIAQLERESDLHDADDDCEGGDECDDGDGACVGLDEHHGAERAETIPLSASSSFPGDSSGAWIAVASMRAPMAIAHAATT